LHHKKQNKPGFSFIGESRDSLINQKKQFHNTISNDSLGPGYYTVKNNMNNTQTCSFSVSKGNDKYADYNNVPQTQNALITNIDSDLPTKNQKSFLTTTNNFQRFGTTKRFIYSQFSRFPCTNKYSKHKLVIKNILLVNDQRKSQKLRKLRAESVKHTNRIQIAQNAKNTIEELEVQKIKQKIDIREKIRKWRMDRVKIYKIYRNWLFLGTLIGWMKNIEQKFELRTQKKEKTYKYLRIIYVSFKAAGKIIKKVRKIREEKFTKLVKKVMHNKIIRWRAHRKEKMLQNFIKFLSNHDSSSQLELFVKSILYNSIIKIQKWYRRILCQRIMRISIINLQWSALESYIIGVEKSEENLTLKKLNKAIRNFIKFIDLTKLKWASSKKLNIPLIIRLNFICEKLKSGAYFIEKRELAQLIIRALIMRLDWPKISINTNFQYPIIKLIKFNND